MCMINFIDHMIGYDVMNKEWYLARLLKHGSDNPEAV